MMSTRLIQILSLNNPHQIKSTPTTSDKSSVGFGPHFCAGNKIFASSSVLTASAQRLCTLGAIYHMKCENISILAHQS